MHAPQNFLECFSILDDIFTKTDLKISLSFLWFHKERIMGNHEHTFPSVDTIARMSKCSKRSVERYIQKYEGSLIIHENRTAKNGKFTSNSYGFCREFFRWLMILDYSQYLKNWTKKTRISILKAYIDDELFLHKMLHRKGVMNNEMADGVYEKWRTINPNSFLERGDNYKVLQGAVKTERYEQPKTRTSSLLGSGLLSLDEEFLLSGVRSSLKDINLSPQEKKQLFNVFLINPLKSAREPYFFTNRENNNVRNSKSFIFGCCRNKLNNTLQRK